MAIIKGTIAGSISGSIGALTFSHNRGGAYIRTRAIPTNPGSPEQSTIRAAMASLSNHWTVTLTEAQRTAWTTYATNVPLINALGDPIIASGLNHYIRSNAARLQAALDRQDDAPTVFNLGEFTEPTFAIDTANDEVDVTFENADTWANIVGSAMLIFASRPVNPTVNYHKGPYRYAGKIAGAVVPPTSPAAIDLPFAVSTGQRIFVRAQVTQEDGRYSASFRGYADAP